MPRIRLRPESGAPILGTNMHIIHGHDRITFVKEQYKPGLILDAACGEGVFSIILSSDRLNTIWAIDLLDSPVAHQEGIKFERMSVYDIPDTYPMFDTILFMEIIEHLEEPDKALGVLMNHLKPDGVLLLTTPHISTWDYEVDHIWRFPDMDSVVEIAPAKSIRLWQDATFIYAVLRKQ